MYKKYDFKNFNGSIYVEDYDSSIEPDRCDILDEYENYIDYIDLNGMTKDDYFKYVDDLLSSKSILDFIKKFSHREYFCDSDRLSLAFAVYRDGYEEEFLDLYHKCFMDDIRWNDETLTDKDFCDKYMFNKIGNSYFYLGDD